MITARSNLCQIELATSARLQLEQLSGPRLVRRDGTLYGGWAFASGISVDKQDPVEISISSNNTDGPNWCAVERSIFFKDICVHGAFPLESIFRYFS
ncbi:hypothetical protein J6590_067630 [Homalodisca vitripennis]|nr:hypothetical protein J6590_067630 [Homalodisca vitripennis]